eukprot:COSAG06_NODE_40715_length_399_cov_0.953333_1_plen_48_part_10
MEAENAEFEAAQAQTVRKSDKAGHRERMAKLSSQHETEHKPALQSPAA